MKLQETMQTVIPQRPGGKFENRKKFGKREEKRREGGKREFIYYLLVLSHTAHSLHSAAQEA